VSRRSGTGRLGTASRATGESQVEVELNLDGTGTSRISTGVPFYDHMLTAWSTHSLVDLTVTAHGDVEVDALVPLDEALAHAVVDVSGRPYFVHSGEPDGMAYVLIGGGGTRPPYAGSLTAHVFESLAHHAGITVHVRLLSGRDPHHIVEAQFKALARALRQAVELDPRRAGVPSTKGSL
jgi:imidazoleglycerol-phosphate dehydratase